MEVSLKAAIHERCKALVCKKCSSLMCGMTHHKIKYMRTTFTPDQFDAISVLLG